MLQCRRRQWGSSSPYHYHRQYHCYYYCYLVVHFLAPQLLYVPAASTHHLLLVVLPASKVKKLKKVERLIGLGDLLGSWNQLGVMTSHAGWCYACHKFLNFTLRFPRISVPQQLLLCSRRPHPSLGNNPYTYLPASSSSSSSKSFNWSTVVAHSKKVLWNWSNLEYIIFLQKHSWHFISGSDLNWVVYLERALAGFFSCKIWIVFPHFGFRNRGVV